MSGNQQGRMIVDQFVSKTEFGAFLAFLFSCVIVMYEKMKHFHEPKYLVIPAALLLCGAFVYKENVGLFGLIVVFFVQATKMTLMQMPKSPAPL